VIKSDPAQRRFGSKGGRTPRRRKVSSFAGQVKLVGNSPEKSGSGKRSQTKTDGIVLTPKKKSGRNTAGGGQKNAAIASRNLSHKQPSINYGKKIEVPGGDSRGEGEGIIQQGEERLVWGGTKPHIA